MDGVGDGGGDVGVAHRARVLRVQVRTCQARHLQRVPAHSHVNVSRVTCLPLPLLRIIELFGKYQLLTSLLQKSEAAIFCAIVKTLQTLLMLFE